MIDGVTNADAIPVLERLMQFAGQRQRLLAHNIANLDTPRFRPVDVSVEDFQKRLGEAIDRRRRTEGNKGGDLEVADSQEVTFTRDGVLFNPTPIGDNILFHDQSDADPERLVQAMVENFMAFRTAADLLKSRFDLIDTAIRERV